MDNAVFMLMGEAMFMLGVVLVVVAILIFLWKMWQKGKESENNKCKTKGILYILWNVLREGIDRWIEQR